jgi:DNA-binding transcriptional LysR family regulator
MKHLQSYIRYFVVIAEELHFRRAAERLFVSQPVLSRAIQQLEEKIGVILLQRSRRHVALTTAGEMFLKECYIAQHAMEHAERCALKAHLGETGKLVIGYTDFAINGRLPSILAAFHEALPGVNIELVRRNSHEQLEDLKSGRLDLGFLTGPVNGNDLHYLCIQKMSFVVVLPDNHRLTSISEVSIKELSDEDFVLGEMHQWRHIVPQIQALCLKAGFIPKVAWEAPSSDSIFGLVAARMGISIHPDCYLSYHRKGIVIRPLASTDAELVIDLTWASNSINQVVPRFIEVTKKVLESGC